ncbi:MAG: four helix bundle protein [Chitinophagaceae bacterium]|nr:MAG: four helix bundle protein [Chitinophagaceae bacterium]
MDRKELERRTRQFHIEVIRLCKRLPKDPAGFETAKQLIRSAGSVGANYRASARAKSNPDFHYKIKVVLEEADESEYWLGVIQETMLDEEQTRHLRGEARQLTAIFTASEKTLNQSRGMR